MYIINLPKSQSPLLSIAHEKMEFNIGLKGSFLRSKKFGRETNFAWQNSEAVVSNPLSPVKFVSHTQVWETCVRRVKFEFQINSTEGSVNVRRTRGFRSIKRAKRYIKNKNKGNFYSNFRKFIDLFRSLESMIKIVSVQQERNS